MTSCSTPSKRSRSSADSQTAYSLGTYVRDTETVLCSSISRASLRAISTGRTWVRKTRPKVHSTRPASFSSRLRRTLIRDGAFPFGRGGAPGRRMLMLRGGTGTGLAGRAGSGRARRDREPAGGDRSGDEPAHLRRHRLGRRAQGRRPRRGRQKVDREDAAAHQEREREGREAPQGRDKQRAARGRRRQYAVEGIGRARLPRRVVGSGGRPEREAVGRQRLGEDEPPAAEGAQSEAVPGTRRLAGDRGPHPRETRDGEERRERGRRPQRPAAAQEGGGRHHRGEDDERDARAALAREPGDDRRRDREPSGARQGGDEDRGGDPGGRHREGCGGPEPRQRGGGEGAGRRAGEQPLARRGAARRDSRLAQPLERGARNRALLRGGVRQRGRERVTEVGEGPALL